MTESKIDVCYGFLMDCLFSMLILIIVFTCTVEHYRTIAVKYGIAKYEIINSYTGEVDFIWEKNNNE